MRLFSIGFSFAFGCETMFLKVERLLLVVVVKSFQNKKAIESMLFHC